MADRRPVAPVYSRSIYHRNAKARSGLMTNPKDYGKQRKTAKFPGRSGQYRPSKTLADGLETLKMIDATDKPAPVLNNVAETRFTIPNSPNNVNIVLEVAKRQTEAHAQVMKKLDKSTDEEDN